MKSCIFVLVMMFWLSAAAKQSKAGKSGKLDTKIQCSALKNQVNSLVSSTKILRDKLSKCRERDRCPREGPDGIYNITIPGTKTFKAPCISCGWMVIQKRFDSSTSFNRSWDDYKNGFGDINREFFFGLERLHIITKAKHYELLVRLRNENGSAYARYDNFKIGSEKEGYELKSLGKHSGTMGDSVRGNEFHKFNTYDRDTSEGCATKYGGGWWFLTGSVCGNTALNGKGPTTFWHSFYAIFGLAKRLEMRIMPKCQ